MDYFNYNNVVVLLNSNKCMYNFKGIKKQCKVFLKNIETLIK